MGSPAAAPDPRLVQCGPMAGLPRPLAFVLSGGAASGATQVGMLRALHEAGVVPDLIVGTSVGAINGVMVAGPVEEGLARLESVWQQIDRDTILGGSSIACLPRLVRTRRHLFPPDSLRALIRRHIPARRFDDLDVPFVAIATRVAGGTPTALGRGDLETALLASAAIPGVFPRVEIDGHSYFDGGITANVPVRQAVELGARSVVVLSSAPAGDRELPTNIAETLQWATHLLMRSQQSADVSHLGEHAIVELPRSSPHGLSPFDFGRTGELIETAYRATLEFLRSGAATPVTGAVPA